VHVPPFPENVHVFFKTEPIANPIALNVTSESRSWILNIEACIHSSSIWSISSPEVAAGRLCAVDGMPPSHSACVSALPVFNG